MAMDDLFNEVTKALDELKLSQEQHAGTADDWITISLPKLRIGASPIICSALDAIENNEEHRVLFAKFVQDAIVNPEFRDQLKKSLSDPAVIMMVQALASQKR